MTNLLLSVRNIFNKRQLLFTFIVVIVVFLVYFLTYDLYGNRIAVSDGFGWDGKVYASFARSPYSTLTGETTLNGETQPHLQISDYSIQRILPSSIIYVLSRILGIDLSDETPSLTVTFFYYYNVLLIIASIYLFYRISQMKRFNYKLFTVGVIFLFVNFSTLRMMPFYSTLTDTSAVFCSLLAIFAYLKNSKVLFVLSFVIAYWTWPFGTVFISLLFLFQGYSEDDKLVEKGQLYPVHLKLSLLVVVALLLYALLFMYYEVVISLSLRTSLKAGALLSYILFVCIYISSLRYPSIRTIQKHISITNIIIITGLLIFNGLLKNIVVTTYDLSGQNVLTYWLFNTLIGHPSSYPFSYFVQSFLYFGPAVLLFFVSSNRIFNENEDNLPLGFLLLMVLSAVFIGTSEARLESFSYPFMVYAICLSLFNHRINIYHIVSLLAISIIAVRFHLGVEQIYSEGLMQYIRRLIFTLQLCIATLLVYYSIPNNKVYSAIVNLIPKLRSEKI